MLHSLLPHILVSILFTGKLTASSSEFGLHEPARVVRPEAMTVHDMNAAQKNMELINERNFIKRD